VIVRRLVGLGSRVDLKTSETNLHATGHRHQDVIDRLDLCDDLYIVDALDSRRVGHAFVLKVAGGERTVIDADGQRAFENFEAWIERVSFVRKVQLVKN
jgi:hypothetical protein